MIDSNALTKVVCQIIQFVTKLPASKIVIGDPNANISGSYCAVRFQGPELWGQAQKDQRQVQAVDDPRYMDIVDITRTQVVLSFSVNFYRDNAMNYATSLLQANKRDPVHRIMLDNQLGWERASPVNNLTGLFSGNMEERAQLEIYLYAEDVAEDTVGRIYNVQYALSTESTNDLAQGQVNGLSG